MNLVTQTFAILAGIVHMGAWLLESVLWRRPATQRLMTGRVDESRTLWLFAFNQGFYNLFLAAGAIGGVVAGNRSVTLFACACMAGAGLVLVVSARRLWRGALGQAVPPLVALLAALA
jgi:putative membrane protein